MVFCTAFVISIRFIFQRERLNSFVTILILASNKQCMKICASNIERLVIIYVLPNFLAIDFNTVHKY